MEVCRHGRSFFTCLLFDEIQQILLGVWGVSFWQNTRRHTYDGRTNDQREVGSYRAIILDLADKVQWVPPLMSRLESRLWQALYTDLCGKQTKGGLRLLLGPLAQVKLLGILTPMRVDPSPRNQREYPAIIVDLWIITPYA